MSEAFKLLDADCDNVISFNDLRCLLDPESVDDDTIWQMIRQVEGRNHE